MKYILGGGVTGLAASMTSHFPVLEALPTPGGICSSYYIDQKSNHTSSLNTTKSYRFEVGGGHWIFGGSTEIIAFIKSLVSIKKYRRKSSVYFPQQDYYAPYPLQNHLFALPDLSPLVLEEMSDNFSTPPKTMEEWLSKSFGSTLCQRFFFPFHSLYTAGLYKEIAPQDFYKSPVNLEIVKQGLQQETSSVGYNVSFIYPEEGLSSLVQKMASMCDISYDHKIEHIDIHNKILHLCNKKQLKYDQIVSTLPLNKMLSLSSLKTKQKFDPHTSVLVLNIGAVRGKNCPQDHWLYIPESKSNFHRVGFYSNVDKNFLPENKSHELVSIYVEKAFHGQQKLGSHEIKKYSQNVVKELQEWGFIEKVDVVDPTWIDVAYTWSWPGSSWKKEAETLLAKHDIYQLGRYACWRFQGIADSIQDGFDIKTRFPKLFS